MSALRDGFTTGSCAAACALASALWQKTGECPERVEIVTPSGRVYAPEILPREDYTCAVVKDSGDDPDITNGCEVRACVRPTRGEGIRFTAGEGVGVVTKPGLKLPVGEAAINPVPREMIASAVRTVYPTGGFEVIVSIPGGKELAEKTFNPRLGVAGGLSVLGTTGIVRPMSEDALRETIQLEMRQKREMGASAIALVFGSQGEKALEALGCALPAVQMSNFVGFALDMARELGFSSVLLAGQPGKLVKVAGGSMQTHSRYGDGRRETLTAHLALMGAPVQLLRRVMESVTLDGVIAEIAAQGYGAVWDALCEAVVQYAGERTRGALCVSAWMLDAQGHLIGRYDAKKQESGEENGE